MSKEETKRMRTDLSVLTKSGGYEEIPRELVLEQARRIGVEEKDIPEIRVEDVEGGSIEKSSPGGKVVVVIPRREPKWKVPDTLRHELSHVKAGYDYIAEKTWDDYIHGELGALKIQGGGRLTWHDLKDLVLALVVYNEQPRRESTYLVMREARKLGTSKQSVFKAKEWLKNYWREYRGLKRSP